MAGQRGDIWTFKFVIMEKAIDLLSFIENMPETEKMKRLGVTKRALLYAYHDAERIKNTDYALGIQIKTLLHIAVLYLSEQI